jgi:hypothetical protein
VSAMFARLIPAAMFSGMVIALAASPAAVANPAECQPTDTVTVCEETGSAAIAAVPGEQTGSGTQNGPYGPAGATPPVGN